MNYQLVGIRFLNYRFYKVLDLTKLVVELSVPLRLTSYSLKTKSLIPTIDHLLMFITFWRGLDFMKTRVLKSISYKLDMYFYEMVTLFVSLFSRVPPRNLCCLKLTVTFL